jgi:two-component system, LytTR family, response regulator LytT
MRTLLVDDEYLALELLHEFLKQIPGIEVIGKETSPLKALETLRREPIDLLFLDIQMPALSGNNLLKTLRNPPVAIFTTAYSEHAVEAFDLDAADYLLKPFTFERLLRAIDRAREILQKKEAAPAPASEERDGAFMTVKSDGKLVKIALDDLLFIEGMGEYVQFICKNSKHIVLASMKHLEETLPAERFLRTHKSYIVAIGKVSAIEGNQLEIGKHKVPVSRERREAVVAKIFG